MIAHRGSARYWLQAVERAGLPHYFRPNNPKWRFRRELHGATVRDIVARLREIADGLESHLEKKQ